MAVLSFLKPKPSGTGKYEGPSIIILQDESGDVCIKKSTPVETRYRTAYYIFVFVLMCVSFASIYMMGRQVSKLLNENCEGKLVELKDDQCSVDENNRFDCWPEERGATQQTCESRGCCWAPSSTPGTAPYCFFPINYNGYNVTDLVSSSTGILATLKRSTTTFFSPDVAVVKLQVDFQTSSRLRIRLFDPDNARFEVPINVPSGGASVQNPLYEVSVQKGPFNIIVKRTSTGATVFDTTGTAPLIFSDQFLQISTQFATKYVFGFGEHREHFLQDVSSWKRLVFWNRDAPPAVDNNGYGTHAFFLNLEPQTSEGIADAHGVFLLNSNAGEVALQPFGKDKAGAVTYRMLGGILDFFIVLGPEPVSVAQQFSDVIGRPYFPPLWSLGFHICKFGLQNGADLQSMIKRNRDAQMPYDVQWSDIDYMKAYTDWSYDKNRYGNLPSIVQDLHNQNQKYIIIIDPGISTEQAPGTYPPFDDGKQMGIFMKNASGDMLIGKVWPGYTAFPDFFHPDAYQYWYKQAKGFHDLVPFDGLWIDMNEPSNFVPGSTVGCTSSKLDNPPYVPPTIVGGNLMDKTVCPSAKHSISSHYNLHNMYGWSEANVTRRAMDVIFQNKRSPLISRSSFASSGRYTGHWTGDNFSAFSEMFYSIPAILSFNLFGIPQIGADICGFLGTTTPELCTRWMELGVFYPFMRNHADMHSPVQDPGSFPSPYQDYMRSALQLRYRLLAVLYTAFYKSHVEGLPIVRPMFYLYPGTEAIDEQFMWGDQLLISPALVEGAVTVNAFIPSDLWYDFYEGYGMQGKGQYETLGAPIDHINVHVRGGSVLPLLPPTVRTYLSQQQKFQLLIAPNAQGNAQGELFWDDGESLDSISAKKYTHLRFALESYTRFNSTILQGGYNPKPQGIKLGELTFLGVQQVPTNVTVNGQDVRFTYSKDVKRLTVPNLMVDLLQPLSVNLD